ncbi:MAG: hypothetical protein IKB70_08200 [Bacilli bacterium]|nr:hypothetical protein [Bacilli bacterium]
MKGKIALNFIGEYKGYNIYALKNAEYMNEHQYEGGKVFCLTDRSNKIMLNGVHIGYLDSKMTVVKEWHPERAPKTWERPGKKAMTAVAASQQRKKKQEEAAVTEVEEADERYQQVMMELDRKYDEMMKRLDERIKI